MQGYQAPAVEMGQTVDVRGRGGWCERLSSELRAAADLKPEPVHTEPESQVSEAEMN